MSDYDGLRSCVVCGNYTLGRLCASCAQQEMIDESPIPTPNYAVYHDEDNLWYYEDVEDTWEYAIDECDEYNAPHKFLPRLRWQLACWRRQLLYDLRVLRTSLRYKFDSKYRASIDEIPF